MSRLRKPLHLYAFLAAVLLDFFQKVRAVVFQLVVADTLNMHHILFSLRHFFREFFQYLIGKYRIFIQLILICEPFTGIEQFIV